MHSMPANMQNASTFGVFELKKSSNLFYAPGCNYSVSFMCRLLLVLAVSFNFAVVGNRRKNTHTLSHDLSWKQTPIAGGLLWDVSLVWAMPDCERASSWLYVSAMLKPKLPAVCSEWICGQSYLSRFPCLTIKLTPSVIKMPEEWVFSSSKSSEKTKWGYSALQQNQAEEKQFSLSAPVLALREWPTVEKSMTSTYRLSGELDTSLYDLTCSVPVKITVI